MIAMYLMVELLLVRVSVWIALMAWFLGSAARLLSRERHGRAPDVIRNASSWEQWYRWSWLLSGVMFWLHILASYGVVHGWDHAAALQHTAEESYEVTGIRASWGVYVNFVFAALVLVYPAVILLRNRRIEAIDLLVFLFLSSIVFSATIVFENGILRIVSSMGFLFLVLTGIATARNLRRTD